MSKDNDDLINELNDFEDGLRDIEKNKPQSSNHDSDGSGPGSHAAILETKFYGKNDKTRIINEGGRTDRDSVNEDGFQSAFYSLLASGRIVICRPVS